MKRISWLLGVALAGVGSVTGFFACRSTLQAEPGGVAVEERGGRAALTALDPIDGSLSRFDRRLALEREFSGGDSVEAKLRAFKKMRALNMDTRQILEQLLETDPAALIEMAAAATRDEFLNRDQLCLAFTNLWKTNPGLAEKLAIGFRSAKGRRDGLGAIVRVAISIASEDEARRLVGKYSEYLSEDFFAAPDVDMARVAPALLELPDGRHSVEMVRSFVKRWMFTDRAGALTWAKTVREGELRDWALGTILNKVAMDRVGESEALLAEIREDVPGFNPSPTTLATMNKARFAEHPVAGIEWAVENLPASERNSMISSLASSVMHGKGIEAAIELLPKVSPGQRVELEKQIAERFSNEDPAAGIEWARGLSGKKSGEVLASLAYGWVDRDLVAARAYIDSGEAAPFPQLASSVAKKFASEDPEAAVAWASGLPDERAGGAHSAAVVKWSQSHAQDASAYAMTLPEGKERVNLLYITGANLIRANIGDAEVWLSSLEGKADWQAGKFAIISAAGSERERLLKALGDE